MQQHPAWWGFAGGWNFFHNVWRVTHHSLKDQHVRSWHKSGFLVDRSVFLFFVTACGKSHIMYLWRTKCDVTATNCIIFIIWSPSRPHSAAAAKQRVLVPCCLHPHTLSTTSQRSPSSPEKQKRAVLWPRLISSDRSLGGINLFLDSSTFYLCFLWERPTCCVAEHGHVNSLHRGWVIGFDSTSISISCNCYTATTATFPDGTALTWAN